MAWGIVMLVGSLQLFTYQMRCLTFEQGLRLRARLDRAHWSPNHSRDSRGGPVSRYYLSVVAMVYALYDPHPFQYS